MKSILFLAVAIFTFIGPNLAHAADGMRVLLTMEQLVEDKVTGSVVLYGNSIDPNNDGPDPRFKLEVNGKKVSVPQQLLSRLAYERRSYSYDDLSGGISNSEVKPLCKMFGPGTGDRLSTLYLTYTDYKITGAELRPVLTEASNCLFKMRSEPNEASAKWNAVKALTSLQMLLELNDKLK